MSVPKTVAEVIHDVIPSLWIDYKSSAIKQYFKEGRALRTETTINNTRDFNIGRRLENLPALRAVAFTANRRLLDVRPSDQFTPGQMSYQLRRLRLRGLIERIEGTHRYRLTERGTQTALFYLCSHARIIRPLSAALSRLDHAIQHRVLNHLHTLLENASELTAAA